MLAVTINANFASSIVISLHMFIIFGEFMTFCVSLYQFLCGQTAGFVSDLQWIFRLRMNV